MLNKALKRNALLALLSAVLPSVVMAATPEMPKGMTVNISYGKGEGSGIPGPAASKFYDKLLGDVTYPKSCKTMLSFNVGMFNDAGGLVRNEAVLVQGPYTAGTKAPINKDVIADPQMQKSNQVTKLVLSGAKCI